MSDPNSIKSVLWNDDVLKDRYGDNQQQYQEHVLKQYLIYVEMADRISNRRAVANTFFLSINTAIVAVLAKFWGQGPLSTMSAVYLAAIMLCIAWAYIIRSYRQLGSVKFRVVGYLEKRLPASPFWSAEWNELGQGKSPSKYTPLSNLERCVPIVFVFLYLYLAIVPHWLASDQAPSPLPSQVQTTQPVQPGKVKPPSVKKGEFAVPHD